ncbi:FAD dependent oxidoreductase domain-containing protein [Dioscorea alata]|uniref:FAD dependent oxidoreductase domain-containing protein n=1 Tax=Dioscorea alata TaxID=55571 RepID=A0ACB7VLN7_DIOAL|nr:FAD dependent oxidoreductase domain-containing protein [Dioscorea alata]
MPSLFLRLLAPPPTFTPNPSPYLDPNGKKYSFNSLSYSSRMKTMLNARMCISSIRANSCSARYAVLGAGFAGLSVAWHLLQHSPKDSHLCIDIYDEVGIGGAASGVSGGLLHPYSPKVKVLWRGEDCWNECLRLLSVAERAIEARGFDSINQDSSFFCMDEPIVCRRGILRTMMTEKNVEIMKENARTCIENCNLELLDKDAAQNLVPHLHVPLNAAVYMPQALSIRPTHYLQALFAACKNQAYELCVSFSKKVEVNLYKESINTLCELAGKYNAVIICLGAKVDMLPELSGKLPLRTCRGVVAQLNLSAHSRDEYRCNSPSILSDAWLSFQGPRTVLMGSTWDWSLKYYSSSVCEDESSMALQELLPKASAVYPSIREWTFIRARAGLRAMPPLTNLGSLPILGCVNDAVKPKNRCMYWLFGGLGSRGLLYHAFLGKLLARAVVSDDEMVLPPELTSWKQMKVWKYNL